MSSHQQSFHKDGTPKRTHEIEEKPVKRPGVGAALVLAIAGALIVLKNLLFGEPASSNTPAIASDTQERPTTADETLATLPQSPEVTDTSEHSGSEIEAKVLGSGTMPEQSASALALQIEPTHRGFDYPNPLAAGNDNEVLYGAEPGTGIDLLHDLIPPESPGSAVPGSFASNGSARDDGDGASGSSAGLDDEIGADDHDIDDPSDDDAKSNRLPVVTAPVILADLMCNRSVILRAQDLLQNAADPDGDHLTIGNLSASSGTLVERADGSWLFTPEADDTDYVIFSYIVTDNVGQVGQTAYIDLVPSYPERSIGTQAADTLVSKSNGDTVDGLGGDDILVGREGDDVLYGGDGSDRIIGGGGNDVIYGESGDDVMFAGAGNDIVYGGEGDDVLFGEDGDDHLFGDAGRDTVSGGSGDDVIEGGDSDDNLYGNDGNDFIVGGAGNDAIVGGGGHDTIVAGTGDDTVNGGEGDDTFYAEDGDGNDSFDGGLGIDTYDISQTSADAIIDLRNGAAASDETGIDLLAGIENAAGGGGDDVFVASEQVNVLKGGGGDDIFVFGSSLAAGLGNGHRDKILDFDVGDRIDLDEISHEFEDQFDRTFHDHGIRRFVILSEHQSFSQPGQLKFKYDTIDKQDVTILQGNIDFDSNAEFEIELVGHYRLDDDDFYTRG